MKIAVCGYYGFGNTGDEALLAGLVRELERRGHELTVLSGDPAATSALHGVRAVRRTRGAPTAMLGADAFVLGGGGLLQDRSSGRSLAYYLGMLTLAAVLRRPAAVFGQSIGPLTGAGRARVARALRGLPVSVRDRPSQALLAELGVDAELGADLALLLDAPASARGTARADAPVLLVPRAGHPEITADLVRVGRALHGYGHRLATLGIQPNEDQPELERLQRELGAEAWNAGTPSEALQRIAGASYVVSARLHGLILAGVARRPFRGFVYDPKVRAFCDEAEARAHDAPVDAAAVAAEIHADLAAGRIPPGVAELARRAHASVDWLEDAVRARASRRRPAGRT